MSHTVTIKPADFSFTVDEYETILSAALRQGIDFPNRCQQGVCSSCVCKRQAGDVKYIEPEPILSEAQKQEGYTYCCIAYAMTDITLHHPFIPKP